MILRRLVMAAPIDAGGFIISNSSPSMRKRTLSFLSLGFDMDIAGRLP